eukprot:TRINITY_DN6807_c0_g2_i2.p1 TRINITY_DN6807_c0_g2~~TRINITY_DN6807_c0_g2_i2.p1  ORF type:complete len:113 (+),score=27.81 TRINITY_DN6807_c0_g2_i2:95-433(+)
MPPSNLTGLAQPSGDVFRFNLQQPNSQLQLGGRPTQQNPVQPNSAQQRPFSALNPQPIQATPKPSNPFAGENNKLKQEILQMEKAIDTLLLKMAELRATKMRNQPQQGTTSK